MSTESPPPQFEGDANEERSAQAIKYWRSNLALIGVLLAVWATVSFGCGILFAEQLNRFKFGNLPLGFWFSQQGSIYVFVALIFIYAWRMDRLDKQHGVSE
jgi:putative solute:sodium symporter small subunit